ncbi:hypothetical protein [Nevskia sp.]|uniref:hypothetical protein n=1 Tax=Nevskia sp. TaxID=1929292 RepID=UPI002600567C|nr:hypothetical protein [Nevskia sp.]
MSLLGDRSASFIVRVWREPGEYDGAACEWRGSIEHIGSGQRQFFRDLDVITAFLKPHLEAIGIDPSERFWERISPSIGDDAALLPAAAPAAAPARSARPVRKRGPRRQE